jgi:hypothetical protein
MNAWSKLKIWWSGVPPSTTELDGGYGLASQNRAYPPGRTRFMTVIRSPAVKLILGTMGAVAVGAITAAISRWLGLP